MKANIDSVLVGSRVILIPYGVEHVTRYHEWMLDEELRTLTASEPLTLEEEYKMQEKWQQDEDKLTFIILSRHSSNGDELFDEPRTPAKLLPGDKRLAGLPMIGDVNIFLNGTPPKLCRTSSDLTNDNGNIGSAFHDSEKSDDHSDDFTAEIEIMIAEPAFRRKGLALQALQLMLGYATGHPESFFDNPISGKESSSDSLASTHSESESEHNHNLVNFESPLAIPPKSLIARISDANLPSIKLFEKLGFRIAKRVRVFQEVEMRYHGPILL